MCLKGHCRRASYSPFISDGKASYSPFISDRKKGQVSCLATTVSIPAQSKAGLVSLPTGLEGSRVQRNGLANLCLVSSSLDLLWDLPDEGSIVAGSLY